MLLRTGLATPGGAAAKGLDPPPPGEAHGESPQPEGHAPPREDSENPVTPEPLKGLPVVGKGDGWAESWVGLLPVLADGEDGPSKRAKAAPRRQPDGPLRRTGWVPASPMVEFVRGVGCSLWATPGLPPFPVWRYTARRLASQFPPRFAVCKRVRCRSMRGPTVEAQNAPKQCAPASRPPAGMPPAGPRRVSRRARGDYRLGP